MIAAVVEQESGQLAGFLDAIRETPEQMDLRLVFADWLEDQGEEAFGSFLRLLAQAHDCQSGEDIIHLQRAFYLYEKHAQTWLDCPWKLACLPHSHLLTWEIRRVRVPSYGTPHASARQGRKHAFKVGNIAMAYTTPLERHWIHFSSEAACLLASGFERLPNSRGSYAYMAAPASYRRGDGLIGRAVIPKLEGLLTLARQLHARGTHWYGLILGWPAFYEPPTAERRGQFLMGCESTWGTRITWTEKDSAGSAVVHDQRVIRD